MLLTAILLVAAVPTLVPVVALLVLLDTFLLVLALELTQLAAHPTLQSIYSVSYKIKYYMHYSIKFYIFYHLRTVCFVAFVSTVEVSIADVFLRYPETAGIVALAVFHWLALVVTIVLLSVV